LARGLEDFFVSKFLGIIKYPYNSIKKRGFSDKKTGKSFLHFTPALDNIALFMLQYCLTD